MIDRVCGGIMHKQVAARVDTIGLQCRANNRNTTLQFRRSYFSSEQRMNEMKRVIRSKSLPWKANHPPDLPSRLWLRVGIIIMLGLNMKSYHLEKQIHVEQRHHQSRRGIHLKNLTCPGLFAGYSSYTACQSEPKMAFNRSLYLIILELTD